MHTGVLNERNGHSRFRSMSFVNVYQMTTDNTPKYRSTLAVTWAVTLAVTCYIGCYMLHWLLHVTLAVTLAVTYSLIQLLELSLRMA